MNKLILLSFVGISMANTAHAGITDFSDIKPYLGTGYTYQNTNDVNLSFLGVNAGLQFNEILGAEIFWNKNVNQPFEDEDLNVQYYGVGLTGKYPLVDNLYAKGLIGFSNMKITEKYGRYTDKYSDSGAITKLGLGYNFSNHIATELAYTYQSMGDGFNGVNLEIKYNF